MADASRGWVVGTDWALVPLIVATTDGGATWTQQTSPSSAALAAISAPNASHAWAVGTGGTIIATTDGGATWHPQNSGVTDNLFDVAFPDAKQGWTVGRRADGHLLILVTTDGGTHWKRQAMSTRVQQQRVNSLAFPDARHGWGVGSVGLIRYHAAPRITGLSPTRGRAGCKLTITGTDFNSRRGKSTVKVGTKVVTRYLYWIDGKIQVRVPSMSAGSKAVRVAIQGQRSNVKYFKVL